MKVRFSIFCMALKIEMKLISISRKQEANLRCKFGFENEMHMSRSLSTKLNSFHKKDLSWDWGKENIYEAIDLLFVFH